MRRGSESDTTELRTASTFMNTNTLPATADSARSSQVFIVFERQSDEAPIAWYQRNSVYQPASTRPASSTSAAAASAVKNQRRCVMGRRPADARARGSAVRAVRAL